ncbi:MAG: flagellar basal body-associated FliL family protein [Alphaproteobacteria bacterium]|nr:flagellar basal body-associated FliL family protein [Alphaproteobacteria bacterium]
MEGSGRPGSRRGPLNRAVWCAFLLAFVAGGVEGARAAGAPAPSKDEAEGPGVVPRFAGAKYYMLEPFVVPLLSDGELDGQVSIVIAIELVDEDHRVDIAKRLPRVRAAMYETLFRTITSRPGRRGVPPLASLKRNLRNAAEREVGQGRIAGS